MENDAKIKSNINIPEELYSSPISSTTSEASNLDSVSSTDSSWESIMIKERRKKFVKRMKIIFDPKSNNACPKIPSNNCKIAAASNDVHKNALNASLEKSSSQSDSDSTTDTSSSSDSYSNDETRSDSTELVSTSSCNYSASSCTSDSSENETLNYKVAQNTCIVKQMENIKIENHSP